MLYSFAAKAFAAWTFHLIWGVAGALPATWVRRPVELYVRAISDELVITKVITDRTVLL